MASFFHQSFVVNSPDMVNHYITILM